MDCGTAERKVMPLGGMVWDPMRTILPIPKCSDRDLAVFLLEKNLPEVMCRSVPTLTDIRLTQAEAATICCGVSLKDRPLRDLIRAYGFVAGARRLIELLRSKRFDLDVETLRDLQEIVGRYDCRTLRVPPAVRPEAEEVLRVGLEFLKTEVPDERARAALTFLFLMRNRPQFGVGRFTAFLAMNGCLVDAGYKPIAFLSSHAEFVGAIRPFLETGCAGGMLGFLERECNGLFRRRHTDERGPIG